ncbi:MAG: PAS domain S-box protein [Sulfuricurvum sp.]|uniref:PAS domain-containing sensor histidine kinase n=1 Tax=Sulfuricurvum sp. TaxID=2025608 RepID=UPI0025CDA15A|nr:PAS domain-containing sensor histidine kinase [Sulfuricurvum sp.]MBV5320352.1 PAS domain S-box protein [Sulfuricurvum sp.]
MTSENELLKEYRNIVDDNFIVSKTDVKGNIIYVNQKFCEISGYSSSELLGKPHNIVRHPDMPAASFKAMWSTILDKRTWRGRITNLNKNGKPYIVESVVSPHLYPDGTIKEFMAVRYEVTEFIEVGKKLLEEKQAREQQKIENEILQKINDAKDSFLVIFTHELKTPLNAVITFSDYIRNTLAGKGEDFEELVELSDSIRESGLLMLSTVETLLDLGKLKANKLTFHFKEFDVGLNIHRLALNHKVLLMSNNLELDISIDDNAFLTSDSVYFSKIVTNLLSNAIKYAGSRICISFHISTNDFIFTVEDDGEGIALENREKIFELFEQVDDSHLTRQAKGTGVGLHFIKLLCNEMGYTIRCTESVLLGGACFEIVGKTTSSIHKIGVK